MTAQEAGDDARLMESDRWITKDSRLSPLERKLERRMALSTPSPPDSGINGRLRVENATKQRLNQSGEIP